MWKRLPQPFSVLAPMDDVTDVVFRQIIATHAPPDVLFTEFTNVEAMNSAGRESQQRRLLFTPLQRPIVAQIWGITPKNYETTARLCVELGFDGIDLNFGCPDKAACKHGACAAMITQPEVAKKVIQATLAGAGAVPVSVKTRLGYKRIQTEEWVRFLLQFPIANLTLHGRTAAELSKVPAHWEEIGKAVEIRNSQHPEVMLVGNGDVKNYAEIQQKAKEYGVNGVMIGRGIFEDPWVFLPPEKHPVGTPLERLTLLQEHLQLWEQTWKEIKPFEPMRKFVKMYVHGWPGSAELRAHMMTAKTPTELHASIAQAIQLVH